MRIGIDCRLPYYHMGGISQYALHLLAALAHIDDENQYTVFHSRKEKSSYLPDASNFSRRDLWTPCHHPLERWTLSLELLLHKLDVLHTPDFIPPGLGANRRIITVHDLNFLYYPEFLTPESLRYYAGQIRWAVRVADHISADSHATRQDLIDRLQVPPEKVTTIYLAANPVYTSAQTDATIENTLRQFNLPSGFILFVGTLEPRKNLPMLFRAYHKMRSEAAVDVPLVLVGSTGWIADGIFTTIDDLDLSPSVRHLAGVEDEQLAHLYASAALVAIPSLYEGFGLPALEAMHCGCPVLASNRASLPEIVGDAGLLLEPEDSDAWAENMARVLGDSALREEMAKKGLSQARKFSWDSTARATLQLYAGG